MQYHAEYNQNQKRAGLVVVLAAMAILGMQSTVEAEPPMSSFSHDSQVANSPRIVEGSKVTFLYHITTPDTTKVDASDVGQFVQGRHEILPALEREIAGMKPGEEKKIELTPEEGFGPYDDKKKRDVLRTELPPAAKKGTVIQDNEGRVATVAEVSDSKAVLDYNHPLAGKALIVQMRILKVENPS